MSKQEVKWAIFSITAMGGFLGMLDASSINIALYGIAKSYQAHISQVQWVVLAYMLTLTALLPLFGKLNDILDRKTLYSSGFVVFAIGATFNIFAPNLPCLILSRIVQAVGASILISNSYAIIATVFKGQKRGKALGLSSAIVALAGMTGPAVGGLIMQFFDWHFIFIPSVIIALICARLSYKLIPTLKSCKKLKFDYLGLMFFIISILSMLLVITKISSWGIYSKKILCLTMLAGLAAFLFYNRERRITFPMINLRLFKNKIFWYGNLAIMLSYFAMFANGILFPIYSQEILKNTPLVTGLLILPFSISLITMAPISGNLAGKHGSKIPATFGAIFIIIALCLFTFFGKSVQLWQIVIAQMLMGIGSGLFQPASNTAVMNAAPKANIGSASGILSLFRNIGMAIGIAVSVSVFGWVKKLNLATNHDYTTSFLSGYHTALHCGIVFATICLLLVFAAYFNATRNQ